MAKSTSHSKCENNDSQLRYQKAKRVTLVGACVNGFLGFAKLVAGFWGNSHALIADGFHSLSDLLTDALVLFAAKFSNREADHDHPYGHQRIETAATMFLAMLLVLAGGAITWDSIEQLWSHSNGSSGWVVLLVAGLSILSNEALYHYTRFVGKRIQSDLIIANAWHHRSDAASSLIVLIGLIGSQLGFKHLDAIAAIIVGLMIVKMGYTLGWNSIRELIDTGLEPEKLTKLQQIIQTIDGVVAIHQLRTRSMGGHILTDVHVQVESGISVSEGHHIAQNVHHRLMTAYPKIQDVTVHIDPEDDEISCPSMHLPSRKQLLQSLNHHWQKLPCYDQIEDITIHYLNGEILLDVLFKEQLDKSLKQQYQAITQTLTELKSVNIFYRT